MKRREVARQVLLQGNSGPLVVPLRDSPHSSISLCPPPARSLCLMLFQPYHHHRQVLVLASLPVISPTLNHFFSLILLLSLHWMKIKINKNSKSNKSVFPGQIDMSHPKMWNPTSTQLLFKLHRLSNQPNFCTY